MKLFIAFLLLFNLKTINCQLNCANAPTPALNIVCEQLYRWDKNSRVNKKFYFI